MTEDTFDPDEFLLDKKQINEIMDAIGHRWSKSTIAKLKNANYILALEAMKFAVTCTPNDVITQIWHDMLVGFNELIRLNQMARLQKEFPDTKAMVKLVTNRIKSGELFDTKH